MEKQKNQKKQYSLSLFMRVLLGVLVVVSLVVFATSAMKYNELLKKQQEYESELAEYRAMKEELEELINSDYDYDTIVKIAKEKWGLKFPDEELFIPKP